MKIVNSDIMKELDRKTIQEHGIPGETLMERAGEGVFMAIKKNFSEEISRGVTIVCGKGNNGGDGFVVGRLLLQDNIRVNTFILGCKEDIKGDARLNLDRLIKLNAHIIEVSSGDDLRKNAGIMEKSGLIVDAIFGTGLGSGVTGIHRDAIEFINSLGKPVVSIDIPSGLSSDTGKILGSAVNADLTVTMGLPKLGQFLGSGIDNVGDLTVVDIGIPFTLVDSVSFPYTLLDESELSGLFPRRRKGSHKGDFGHLLILAGSVGKTGAAALTAMAAVRTGAGLVTIGVPESIYPIIASRLNEAMPEPLPETGAGTLSSRADKRIKELLEGKDALAVGPGLSTHSDTKKLLLNLVEKAEIPMVVDADGVNNLSGSLRSLGKAKAARILTPHPGEMARLIKSTNRKVQEDRIRTARDFAKEHGVVLVLKGARTIIADPKGNISINSSGNPGMASGGMGDVLTGMIGSLLAQGFSPYDAARAGVFLHGWAADRVADELGEAGMSASDLLEKIPLGIKRLARTSR